MRNDITPSQETEDNDPDLFEFYEMNSRRLPADEIRVSYAKLRRLATDLDEKVFRAQYYDEKTELHWLRTFSEDLSRLLRGNRE